MHNRGSHGYIFLQGFGFRFVSFHNIQIKKILKKFRFNAKNKYCFSVHVSPFLHVWWKSFRCFFVWSSSESGGDKLHLEWSVFIRLINYWPTPSFAVITMWAFEIHKSQKGIHKFLCQISCQALVMYLFGVQSAHFVSPLSLENHSQCAERVKRVLCCVEQWKWTQMRKKRKFLLHLICGCNYKANL